MQKIHFAIPLLLLAAAGCSGGAEMQAAPNFFNGHYYMAGDPTCTNITQIAPGRIMCSDPTGQQTGWRDAMTDQQLQMYQHNRQVSMMQAQINQQQAAQIAQQTAMFSASMQPYTNPQTYLSNYTAPQVMPMQLGGSQVRCISASLYTNCRY